jgi:hypothetical protein
MREHYGLDRLVEHGISPIPETTLLINPAWRALDSQVRRTLAARGDYCRVAKKSGADTFHKSKELTQRKPLTETPSHGEKF